jgi:hypothetical protein
VQPGGRSAAAVHTCGAMASRGWNLASSVVQCVFGFVRDRYPRTQLDAVCPVCVSCSTSQAGVGSEDVGRIPASVIFAASTAAGCMEPSCIHCAACNTAMPLSSVAPGALLSCGAFATNGGRADIGVVQWLSSVRPHGYIVRGCDVQGPGHSSETPALAVNARCVTLRVPAVDCAAPQTETWRAVLSTLARKLRSPFNMPVTAAAVPTQWLARRDPLCAADLGAEFLLLRAVSASAPCAATPLGDDMAGHGVVNGAAPPLPVPIVVWSLHWS